MDSKSRPLNVFFLPFMAQGHMIPAIDMARLFTSQGEGVHWTIVTTPMKETFISNTMSLGLEIGIKTIPFSPLKVGLPDGCENFDMIPSPAYTFKFLEACLLLQEPFEQLLEEERPDCVVADMFFPWATESAAKLGIPRLGFHGIGFFALCVEEAVRVEKPYELVSSDTEPFVVQGLPDKIHLTKNQLPMMLWEKESVVTEILKAAKGDGANVLWHSGE